jgi:hypothetical protein
LYLIIDGKVMTLTGAAEKPLSQREGQRFVVREEVHDFIVDESSARAADSEEATATTA